MLLTLLKEEPVLENRGILLIPLISILIISCNTGWSQTPLITWERFFGGWDEDWGNAILQNPDESYMITGHTTSFGAGLGDVYLLKINPQGDTLWTKTYGGWLSEWAYAIQKTADSGYLLAGETSSFGGGGSDVYLVKTNTNGDTLWTKTIGNEGWEVAFDCKITSDSGFIIVGEKYDVSATTTDILIIKTDMNGDTLWTRTYFGPGWERAYAVNEIPNEGYIIAGSSNIFGSGESDILLIKTNFQGDTIWTRYLGGPQDASGNAVIVLDDHSYIVAGIRSDSTTLSSNTSDRTIKRQDYGNYIHEFSPQIYRKYLTAHPYYYKLLSTLPHQTGQTDMSLMHISQSGELIWERSYGGPQNEGAVTVQRTSDGGYILGGTTTSFGGGFSDMYIVKVDAAGDTLWTRTFGGEGTERALDIQITHDDGYVISGTTNSFGSGSTDIYVLKTDDAGRVLTQLNSNPMKIPIDLRIIPNYPNPFNTQTNIEYFLPEPSRVILDILNIEGQKVTTVLNRFQSAGSHQVKFDGLNYPSGIYFYRIKTDQNCVTARMVLLK